MANVSVIGDGASLSIKAGDDINLTGAVLTVAGTDSQVVLEAGHDINLKTQALHSKADMTENANNYIRTERGTELGTDIQAKGDGKTHQTSHTGTKVVGIESVTIQSGQDTNIRGSQV